MQVPISDYNLHRLIEYSMGTGQERRRFLIGAAAAGGGVLLVGGAYAVNKLNQRLQQIEDLQTTLARLQTDKPSAALRQQNTPKPPSTSTQPVLEAPTQTAISSETPTQQITLTPTETLTPTPEYLKSDAEIAKDLETTSGGQNINLKNPLITYVVKIPRPFTRDAVYAVLGVQTSEGSKGIGIIENFDCELKELDDKNMLGSQLDSKLGPVSSGIWKPQIRFGGIDGKVFIESSTGTVPMVTSASFTLGGISTSCSKQSIFEGSGELPKKAARKVGELIQDIIEGFENGYFEK